MYTCILVFIVFLKNRNIISKIKRSKVTDYAALRSHWVPCITTRMQEELTGSLSKLISITFENNIMYRWQTQSRQLSSSFMFIGVNFFLNILFYLHNLLVLILFDKLSWVKEWYIQYQFNYLTLKAPRKNASEKWRLLKSSAANNCLT